MEVEQHVPVFRKFLLNGFDNEMAKVGDPLEYLMSVTTSCLLNETRYYETDDMRRDAILGALELVEELEPEFILQLAVYIRRELGVRTTTNFILAYAACSERLRQLLPKYFSKATVLPADLIEVVQFVQIIHLLRKGQTMDQIRQDNELDKFEIRNNIFMPNQLKKVLIPKILGFGEYQLGKYCSEASRKAVLDKYISARKGKLPRKLLRRKARAEKLKALEKQESAMEVEKPKPVSTYKGKNPRKIIKKHKQPIGPAELIQSLKKKAVEYTFLTMKDLVGLLHIKPTKLTSAIIGAKYPKTKEEFEKKFGEGGFDETLAGKRMHVPIPVTWETQLSTKGNNVEVWSELITNNKVPYLATLRNLRNIVLSGVPAGLISKVAHFLENPTQVEKAKTTPLQYYSALDELNKLLKPVEKKKPGMKEAVEAYHGKKGAKKEEKKEEVKEQPPIRVEEIGMLKTALTRALQLSIANVEEIQGVTQIFVDVSGSMKSPLSGGKSFGSVRQCFEMSILLGLMVMSRCKKCEYYIFSSVNTAKCYILMNEQLNGELEHDIEVVKKAAATLGGGTDFPVEVVTEATANNKHIDNMIILSDMMISQDFGNGEGYIQAIDTYRKKVNPKLKVFSVDLRGYSKAQDIKKEFAEHNFVRIYGANASILKFISASETGQIDHIRKFHTTLP